MRFQNTMTAIVGALALTAVAGALPTRASPEKPSGSTPAAKEDPKPAQDLKATIGKPAPDFELKDLDGKTVKLADYKGKVVVLEWFDPTCPACGWAYGEGGPLRTMPEELKKKGVVWLAMNSAGAEFGGSDVKKNQEFAKKNGMTSPVLLDPKGEVGRKYGAKTTPHMYVIDAKGVLAYMGGLDNAPYGKVEGDKRIVYVEDAVKAVLDGKKVETPETRSYG
ncbi:MAG: redoxin domain-containing protein [Planctomycetota bacterium]|nr:redoxin domain-containing protein [Planctomycetota bacterium]